MISPKIIDQTNQTVSSVKEMQISKNSLSIVQVWKI